MPGFRRSASGSLCCGSSALAAWRGADPSPRSRCCDGNWWTTSIGSAPNDSTARLAVYQVLPGPEAQELCIYFGMLAKGRLGGFLAGLSFLLPGFLLMLALAWWYTEIGMNAPVFVAAFAGAQAAVMALIVRGLHRIGARAVTDWTLGAIAIAAFVASAAGLVFAVPLLVGAMAYPLARRGYRVLALALIGLMLMGSVALATVARTGSRRRTGWSSATHAIKWRAAHLRAPGWCADIRRRLYGDPVR